jgi:hypothetical protein
MLAQSRSHVLVTCLPPGDDLSSLIRKRGGVPLLLGDECLFELSQTDVKASWASTQQIRKPVAGAMVAELAHRLSASLEEPEIETGSLAGDAAACFFLSLHHAGVSLKQALAGSRILWDDSRRLEQVEYLT